MTRSNHTVKNLFSSVGGFEFENSLIKKLRNCDYSLKIIFKLQDNGVAVVEKNIYDLSAIKDADKEYWTTKEYDKDHVIIVTYEWEDENKLKINY